MNIIGPNKVKAQVGGWEIWIDWEKRNEPFTFGSGSQYWGPIPVSDIPEGMEYEFNGIAYPKVLLHLCNCGSGNTWQDCGEASSYCG